VTGIHSHELTGLKPDALATYLAALGVMRLLSRRDPEARGYWRNEHINIVTALDWPAIEQFFLNDYSPTPILAPWNKDSGFFSLSAVVPDEPASTTGASDDDEGEPTDDCPEESEANAADEPDDDDKTAVGDPRLELLEQSIAPRFEVFRRAVNIARDAIPKELRSAEQAVRRSHGDLIAMTSQAREKCKDATRFLDVAKEAAADLNRIVTAAKGATKGAPKGSPAHQALAAAQERYRAAKNEVRAASHESEQLKVSLAKAMSQAKRDADWKTRKAKANTDFTETQKRTKARLIANLRVAWGTEGREWVDAAVALDRDGDTGFTSLFGSGGNDGRMEFTRNLRKHLDSLFDLGDGKPRGTTAALLHAALFGTPARALANESVGQFFPGRAGGSNMAAGFAGSSGINPWEFILMLEGAVALVAGMSRRGEIDGARVSSPFWVESTWAGFGSASQQEDAPRGEHWLPLWSQPIRYDELVELVREGRAQVGRRQTTRASDLVRATARLGLARGIESLQRFAFLERNGQANLAVFTGRFHVAPRSRQGLLDDVAPWIDHLAREGKDGNAPKSLGVVARRATEAFFAVCKQDASAHQWRRLFVILGEAEFALARSGKTTFRRPLPKLGAAWLRAVDDGTPEGRTTLRLAVALASQHRPLDNNHPHRVDHVRRHFLPLAQAGARVSFKLDGKGRIQPDPEHVCHGRDLVNDAIALVLRRSIWARSSSLHRDKAPKLPLEAVTGCEATLAEVGAWVRGEIPDDDVLELVRPLLALDWSEVAQGGGGIPRTQTEAGDPLQMLLRLAHLPFALPVRDPDGRSVAVVEVRLDPEALRRLAAGDMDGALRVAVRRLSASGLRPVFRRGIGPAPLVRRIAASLAFPISRDEAAMAAQLVCKPYELKSTTASIPS
jgi:CRISPR-associated protein Csx17